MDEEKLFTPEKIEEFKEKAIQFAKRVLPYVLLFYFIRDMIIPKEKISFSDPSYIILVAVSLFAAYFIVKGLNKINENPNPKLPAEVFSVFGYKISWADMYTFIGLNVFYFSILYFWMGYISRVMAVSVVIVAGAEVIMRIKRRRSEAP